MKSLGTIILSLIWIFIFCLELLIWNVTIRTAIFDVNAVIDMGASFLSDLIWIPIALLLPFITFNLITQNHSISLKILLKFLAFCIAVAGFLYLPVYFKYLFVLLLLFFITLLFSAYKRKITIHHLFYTLVILYLIYHYNSQLIPKSEPRALGLKVMSWNIGLDDTHLDTQDMLAFIKQEKADIICIQEFQTHQRRFFVQELSSLYPYQKWSRRVSDYGGGAIISQIPFINSELITINSEYDPSHPITITHASVQWKKKHIDIYNCHLHHSANYLLNQFVERRDFMLYNKKAQIGYMRHRDEAYQLATKLFPHQNPLIVTGDFNDTPNSWVYQLYSRYLKNSFASAGWGLGTTFAEYSIMGWIPIPFKTADFNVLRIDHIFYSKEFQISNAKVFDNVKSGHKPQTAILY